MIDIFNQLDYNDDYSVDDWKSLTREIFFKYFNSIEVKYGNTCENYKMTYISTKFILNATIFKSIQNKTLPLEIRK